MNKSKSYKDNDYKIEKHLQVAMQNLMAINIHEASTNKQIKALTRTEAMMNSLHAIFGIRDNLFWWQRPIIKN